MAAYKGDHYVVTYEDASNGDFTADVYAKDEADAKAKVLIAYSWAQNLSATSGDE